MMMIQQERAAAAAASVPTPKKRKGKFKKSRLRLLKRDGGSQISMPTGKVMKFLFLHVVIDSVCLASCPCLNVFCLFCFLLFIGEFESSFCFVTDFRHNITIQLTPSRAELNRLQVQLQNGS